MADIDSHAEAAFSAASDWTKQVLTLSTGIVATTVALGDTLFGQLSDGEKLLLWVSWGLYVLSIVCGLWALMALTGTMGQASPPTAVAIYASNNKTPVLAQLLTFVAATAVLAVFGGLTVGNPEKPATGSTTTAAALVRSS